LLLDHCEEAEKKYHAVLRMEMEADSRAECKLRTGRTGRIERAEE
jgi:HrpA-like RNA helicase